MTDSSDHKNIVREEFTKQAEAYASNISLTSPKRVDRLIQAVDPSSEARVLEIATGPGHVAFEFAEVCDEVLGIDLTKAPLAIAKETKQKRDIDDVHFQKADAETLPFENGTFDVVICRLAFHHFEKPSQVLKQMIRVCRPDGIVGVADLVVSEHSKRANYQNQFERLRDPSHVRALSLRDLIEMFAENGLELSNVKTGKIVQEMEQWLNNAQTPEPRADKARRMIIEDANHDLSGTNPFWQDDDLHFNQRTAIVVGRLLKSSAD